MNYVTRARLLNICLCENKKVLRILLSGLRVLYQFSHDVLSISI